MWSARTWLINTNEVWTVLVLSEHRHHIVADFNMFILKKSKWRIFFKGMLEFVDISNRLFESICKGRKINKAIFIIHLFSVLFSSIYLQHYYAIIILALSHAYIFVCHKYSFLFQPFYNFFIHFHKIPKIKVS